MIALPTDQQFYQKLTFLTPVQKVNEIISTQATPLVEYYYHSHSLTLADALIGSTALWHG